MSSHILDYEAHFWKQVDKTEDCWLWKLSTDDCGYGQVFQHGKRYLAHRRAYQYAIGPIPKGMFVCHTCDNPICVKPAHLFLGTPRDNTRDSIAKGRWAVGERVTTSKLTATDITSMRDLYWKERKDTLELATMFAISRGHVCGIVSLRQWKHLPYEIPTHA